MNRVTAGMIACVIAVAALASADPAKSCDFAALDQKGNDYYARGLYSAALAAYEQALTCKMDPRTAGKAGIAACRAGKAASAKKWYAAAEAGLKSAIQQSCAVATPPIFVP